MDRSRDPEWVEDGYSEETQPSKTARKKEAHEWTAIAKRLAKLTKTQLAQTSLTDEFKDQMIKIQGLNPHSRSTTRELRLAASMLRNSEESLPAFKLKVRPILKNFGIKNL